MDGSGSSAMFFFAMSALWGVGFTIFFMVVAWRAMRAHELISQVLIRDLQPKHDGATPISETGLEQHQQQ